MATCEPDRLAQIRRKFAAAVHLHGANGKGMRRNRASRKVRASPCTSARTFAKSTVGELGSVRSVWIARLAAAGLRIQYLDG